MSRRFLDFVALMACCTFSFTLALAQPPTGKTTSSTRFPYLFSNFVWWTDAELRTALKSRIPALGNQIETESQMEAKVRVALTELLKQKGIHAEVQSFNPSPESSTGKRVPGAPPPSIIFSILGPPEILVEGVLIDGAPPDAGKSFYDTAVDLQGKPYVANGLWYHEQQLTENLQESGYLSATLALKVGQPTKRGEDYIVPLRVIVSAGPRYHVARVSADGGPLMQGRDLLPYASLKVGDVATPNAFGRLAGALRSVYWHAGYPDVDFSGPPILDTPNALATYKFEVVPGPLYHLRSLKIEKLNPAQESQVRDALDLKAGDIYDALAVTTLNRKLEMPGSPLKGYSFTYNPQEDKVANVVDLTLTFYKQ